MSNQDQIQNFKLNPGAQEFVPNFGGASSSSASSSTRSSEFNSKNFNNYQEPQQQPCYNNSNPKPYNPNYNNNGGGNPRFPNNSRPYNNNMSRNYNNGYNGNYNNSRGGSSSNHYNSNRNNYYHQNPNEANVDAIEMEARCEAVIEILQDDRLRSVINPNFEQEQNSPQGQDDNIDQFDDEEEMFEMMAMQEECRLEMMKFYIQSQNPGLFEEVYHGVSYPDEQLAKQQNDQPQQQQQQSSFSHPAVETQSFSLANPISLKDLIANDLNINATEFDPLSLASLSLKD